MIDYKFFFMEEQITDPPTAATPVVTGEKEREKKIHVFFSTLKTTGVV